jgi:hypothetical protein
MAPAAHASPWITQSQDGQLHYQSDDRGNRIPDFSVCGYAGGDRPIPQAPVRIVVPAKPGDATARIQHALDTVSRLAPDEAGLRGAVLLLRGRHEVVGGLQITNPGVVLRGQGMGANGTTLVATGTDRRTLIRVAGRNDCRATDASPRAIIADYVPVGATRLALDTTSGLEPGDLVRITRPSTQEWIVFLGATDLGGGVAGWRPGTRDIGWHRTVTRVTGNEVTLDAPLTTALEKRFGGGSVERCRWPGRLTQVGIENLRLESAFDPTRPKDEDHAWCAITMENSTDSWVRQVTFAHFAGSAVALWETAGRITVQDCLSLAPVSENGGHRRDTFLTQGQQTLFLRCHAENGRHDFGVGHCAAGPNAFVQCEAVEALADSGPLEGWAAGVLYDNVRIDGNALTLGFRPGNNAAIGWSAANSVLWNCNASVIRCWDPPGAHNWSFGSWGSFEGNGVWSGSNDFMRPDSLYAAQVRERLGPAAADRLQLMRRSHEGATNPTLGRAQGLAVLARQPQPQLRDYIARASTRDPINAKPQTAPSVDDLAPPIAPHEKPPSLLVLTNGWLTVNGRLLVGGTTGVAWWRGTTRPAEATHHGVAITRFVPGRIGPGLTDDLRQVADTMVAGGKAALDHNHGLWYDRRRDDHARTRRIDGAVLAPFFEQPFARSGQGTAWDGLSRYDLTRFNPWYWSRLRQFADLCEERGLVLFHQQYFQHNILEAGAHWADFPWRTANNINETGFPEPPPYAGDKRIFQADLFYDVTHPARRRLHEGYIRQCLENSGRNANVIQFIGAEFTGPLHFMEFWLDTIAAWENPTRLAALNESTSHLAGQEISADSRRRLPIIALSATKDVQDAILADPQRGALIDVIDFRYWWRTDRGEFAPPGGSNLAPRQFERRWRGGRPKDTHLAGMAAEYRARFPDRALICDFEAAGWAWVCAGGSLPRLPQTTDPSLLRAIPRMQPWSQATTPGRFVLREPGRQWLVHGGPRKLDLSHESGRFRIRVIDPRAGTVRPGGTVDAGPTVPLPDAPLVWLTRE